MTQNLLCKQEAFSLQAFWGKALEDVLLDKGALLVRWEATHSA